MTIIDSELLMLKSEIVSDVAANGGRMDNNASVTSGVLNNVFPSVFRSERIAGSTKYRKTFLKVANDDDDTLFNPQIWLDRRTPGDDWVVLFAGTQVDTQADIGGGEDCYGCAILKTNVAASAGSIIVTVEDSTLATGAADEIFRDGDTIRISNKDTPDSGTGTEEIHVIDGAPSVSGNDVTISLTGTLSNAYNTDDNLYGTRVMSVLEPSDIEGSVTGVSETTAGDGTYNNSSYPILIDNIGSIEQTVTITFDSATTFTAASNVAGVSLTGGNTTTDYTPSNDDVSKPYFSLELDGWTGTWASGDTLVFTTHPASTGIWQKRVVPANADSISGNRAVVVFAGEAV